MSVTYHVDDLTVELSRESKVLFPNSGITKADLASYYERIGSVMLPHLRERPISMKRYPDGIDHQGFYQKSAPDYFPEWFDRAAIELREGGGQLQLVCNNVASLVYLAGQGCITPHVWLSRRDRLEYPDRMVFDLDPPGNDFAPVRYAARLLREALDRLELTSHVMLTGSTGAHVVVALDGESDFETVRKVAAAVAERVAANHPADLTVEQRTAKRGDRLFLDVTRNAYGQTVVPPYAVRARPGAPVAAPLDWEELGGVERSAGYEISNIFRRLGQKSDPFAGLEKTKGSAAGADERLQLL